MNASAPEAPKIPCLICGSINDLAPDECNPKVIICMKPSCIYERTLDRSKVKLKVGKFLFLLAIILLSAQLEAQTPLRVKWDYPDSEIQNISTFEVKLDGVATYTAVGIPTPELFPDTMPGNHSYTYTLPNLSNGNHSFVVRACIQSNCSFDASLTFRQIGPPQNLRIVRE